MLLRNILGLVLNSRKDPKVTPWAGWRQIFLAFSSPSLEIGSLRHITPLSGSSKSI